MAHVPQTRTVAPTLQSIFAIRVCDVRDTQAFPKRLQMWANLVRDMLKTAPGRGVFCNRTLNMKQVKAVGYDMDYTLVHYAVEEWERRAYEGVRDRLKKLGVPIDGLEFDPKMIIRGLILDTQLGNIVKANRFGFVKKALHGTKVLDFREMRAAYERTIVDLHDQRWVFLNTLFSLSEGCLYAQLVDRLDGGKIARAMGYRDLYGMIRDSMDKTHMEGKLKEAIIADPARFVMLDPDTPLALLDQKYANKKLMLITNSEWSYTLAMMKYTFDPFLPKGMVWRDLFDYVIVNARKPEFFSARAPFFEVATEEGLLKSFVPRLERGKAYLGGSAIELERHLGLSGDEILYVGDHMFGDVHVTKNVLRWRTALVLRELEEEVQTILAFSDKEHEISLRMAEKEAMEAEVVELKVYLQRMKMAYGPQSDQSEAQMEARMTELREKLSVLDAGLAPLAKEAAELSNATWGLLTRAGNDKSHLARQIERYADVYTSRVSNFLNVTPFVYLRSPRGSLPHDPVAPGGTPTAAHVLDGT